MTEELPLCECGCGEPVTKLGNRFLHGHYNRGRPRSDETKQKLRDANIGKTLTDSHKLAISKGNEKRFEDPEEREKISKGLRKRYEDPEERKKTSDANKKRYEDPEERKRTSEDMKNWHKEHPDEWKGKNGHSFGRTCTETMKLAISKANSDPNQLIRHHVAYDFRRPDTLTVLVSRKFHSKIHNPKGIGVHQRGYSLID